MELVTLSEFLQLTLLGDRELLSMLENGELRTSLGPEGELLVDISSVTPETIANRRRTRPEAVTESDLDEEIVASEVLSAIDEILDESLEMSIRWLSEKESDEPELDEEK